MRIVRLSDHSRNGVTDWDAYRAAEAAARAADIDDGVYCSNCHAVIFFPSRPGRTLCVECAQIDKAAELAHHLYIRCPKCSQTFDPAEHDYYNVFRPGDHQVQCPTPCAHVFSIQTMVRHTFISPPRPTT